MRRGKSWLSPFPLFVIRNGDDCSVKAGVLASILRPTKNPKLQSGKLALRKYDSKVRKHVLYREAKA